MDDQSVSPAIQDAEESSLITDFHNLEKKVETVKDTFSTVAQIQIHFDLIKKFEEEFRFLSATIISELEAEVKSINTCIEQFSAAQEQLKQQPQTPETKDQLKIQTQHSKSFKTKLTTAKQNLSALKTQLNELKKQITAKHKNLKSLVSKIEKQRKDELKLSQKIPEQRQFIEYIRFPAFSENQNTNQHKFFAGLPQHSVLYVDQPLAAELTAALALNSFNAILEELGYLLDTSPEQIMVVYKSGLKFSYDAEVGENLRLLYASYNKNSKSWWLSPRGMDYHTTQKLYTYLTHRYPVILDLDNKLLYTLKDRNTLDRIKQRYSHPKMILLSEPHNTTKAAIAEAFSQQIERLTYGNPFDEEKGFAIYNPDHKQFEIFKKSSVLNTKVPQLLLRFSLNGTQCFYLVDSRNGQVIYLSHDSNPRYEIMNYRNQLTGITEDDFALYDIQ